VRYDDIERDSDGPLSADNNLAIGHESHRSGKVNYWPENGPSRAFALLDTLIERKEKDYSGRAASRPLGTIGFHNMKAEAEATPSETPRWLID
jgi:hypothetical protein